LLDADPLWRDRRSRLDDEVPYPELEQISRGRPARYRVSISPSYHVTYVREVEVDGHSRRRIRRGIQWLQRFNNVAIGGRDMVSFLGDAFLPCPGDGAGQNAGFASRLGSSRPAPSTCSRVLVPRPIGGQLWALIATAF
jgi:hypothetical protein